jgi:hypothetical protein
VTPEAVPVAAEALGTDLSSAALALARRVHAGATLWCWSPQWPQHARHVAVEFVHPVVMGKRAVPAEAVAEPDPSATLRAVVRTGDVLIVVADASVEGVVPVLSRARAWGAESFWIGAGSRPGAGDADHVLWLDGHGAEAAHTGDLVLVYHLLWELTHVCLEHSGLMGVERPACGPPEVACITCGDEGRLGEVQRAVAPGEMLVRTAAGCEIVDTALVGPLAAGDLVVVHAGTAIGRFDIGGT